MSTVGIKCNIHGDIEVEEHLYEKYGCPRCYIEDRAKRLHQSDNSDHWQNIKFTRFDSSEEDGRRYKSDAAKDAQAAGQFKSQSQVIAQFRSVHGDRYNYSRVIYKGTGIKVEIVCPVHGVFSQTPYMHLDGQGCPKCATDSRRLSTETVIDRFKSVHGNRYDYSKVQFVDSRTKVTITCKKHGDFSQTVHNHIYGYGCRKCGGGQGEFRISTDKFVERLIARHGNFYDYSRVIYAGAQTNVTIGCPEHGDFQRTPSSLLSKSASYPCHKCHLAKRGSPLKGTRNPKIKNARRKILEEFECAHGGRYDYSKVDYRGVKHKVVIGCEKHGDFLQSPDGHKRGAGCPHCARDLQKEKRKGQFNP